MTQSYEENKNNSVQLVIGVPANSWVPITDTNS
jgi:hypothetical protein